MDKPEFVCFSEIQENEKGNIYILNCCSITGEQISRIAEPYCTYVLEKDVPKYDEENGIVIAKYAATYSRTGWQDSDR